MKSRAGKLLISLLEREIRQATPQPRFHPLDTLLYKKKAAPKNKVEVDEYGNPVVEESDETATHKTA